MNISYTIKILLLNKISNTTKEMNKTFLTSIDETVKETILYSGYILDLMKAEINQYLYDNNIDYTDIDVEEYESVSNTDNVTIYFKSDSEDNTYTLHPTIVANYEVNGVEINQVSLNSEALNDTTIKWYWDADDCAHYIFNENNEVIAQLPIGVNLYVETGLTPQTTYTRYLLSYNEFDTADNKSSSICTTKETDYIGKLKNYKESTNEDVYINNVEIIEDKLKAFHSGVGDNKDCLLIKKNQDMFNESFNLEIETYSVKDKDIIKYDQVNFDYRVYASSKFKVNSQDGEITYKAIAYPIEKGKFRIYRYASKPIEIACKIEANVAYSKPKGDGTYTNEIKNVHTIKYFNFLGDVKYNGQFAELINMPPTAATTKTVRQIIQEVIDADTEFNGAINISAYDFKVLDDYDFNTTTYRYSSTATRTFKNGGEGSVILTANDADSVITMSGICEAQLYDAEKTIEKELSNLDGSVPMVIGSDFDLTLTNIADRTLSLSASSSDLVEVHTEVSVEQSESLVVDEFDKNATDQINARVIKTYISPTLTHYFTDTDPYANVFLPHIFKDFENGQQYIYKITIVNTVGNIQVNDVGTSFLNNGDILTFADDDYFFVRFYSNLRIVDKESLECIPALNEVPLRGIVNGRFEKKSPDGKADFVVNAPMFFHQAGAYDIEYKVVISNIFPNNAVVTAEFLDGGAYSETSTKNGDQITFSSNTITTNKNEEYSLLSKTTSEVLTLQDFKQTIFTIDINKPTIPSNSKRVEVKVSSNNCDVVIKKYNKVVEFTDSVLKLLVTCQGVQNAASRWNPYIHNGYYYLNQHEYFLYSNSKPKGNYELSTIATADTFSYTMQIECVKPSTVTETYEIIKDKEVDLASSNNCLFEDGYIVPSPIFVSEYIKKYNQVTYISPIFNFPNIVSDYINHSWSEVVPNGASLKVYIRAYNNKFSKWGSWVLATNNSVPIIMQSSSVQYKVIFNVGSVEGTIKNIVNDSCYESYLLHCDPLLSNNLEMGSDTIAAKNKTETATYISTVFDFGEPADFRLDMYHSGNVKMYLACCEDESIKKLPVWKEVTNASKVRGRYVRYKLVLEPRKTYLEDHPEVFVLFRDITSKTITNAIPKIGNFKIKATYDVPGAHETITFSDTSNVPIDTNEHTFITSIRDKITPLLSTKGYTIEDIVNFKIINNDINKVAISYKNIALPTDDSTQMKTIFEKWYRFSHKGYAFPSDVTELSSWTYDMDKNTITSTKNSTTYIGFVSDESFSKYKFSSTFKSDVIDDDIIGLVIGFIKDSVTGKEYTLSVVRSPGNYNSGVVGTGGLLNLAIVYNFTQPDQSVIANIPMDSTDPSIDGLGWSGIPNGTRIEITKDDNMVTLKASQWNDPYINNSSATFTLDLNSNSVLEKFNGDVKYGYSCLSQQNAYFEDTIFINLENIDGPATVKTNEKLLKAYETDYVLFSDNQTTLSPLPQQFCPIIVKEDTLGELEYVPFIDSNGNPTFINTEYFSVQSETKHIFLEYKNVDPSTLNIYVNGILNNSLILNVEGNIISLNDYINKCELKIEYKIKNSFIALFDIEKDEVTIKCHAETEIKKAIVSYEANKIDNKNLLNNISLNPIFNSDYKGFIYIDYTDNIPFKLIGYATPYVVNANSNELITFTAQLVDIVGNPVKNEDINITCLFGTINISSNTTDDNGVVYGTYLAATIKCVDNIILIYNDLKEIIKIKNI